MDHTHVLNVIVIEMLFDKCKTFHYYIDLIAQQFKAFLVYLLRIWILGYYEYYSL